MHEPEDFVSLKGVTIPRKISVEEISFSAHVDYAQNAEFIELVKAQHVVSFSRILSLPETQNHVLDSGSRRTNCHGTTSGGDDFKIQGKR